MFRLASFLLSAEVLLAYAGVPHERHPVARVIEARTIPALLRVPSTARSEEGLLLRQSDTCDVGYYACSDGSSFQLLLFYYLRVHLSTIREWLLS